MKITNDLMLIDRNKVENFFQEHIIQTYSTIKDTYLNHYYGKSKNPPSGFLWFDEERNSRIISLPAYLGDKESLPGIKWIASCPHNIENNLPRASAVIILNDFETGFPVAVIEGSVISALRTVLSAILGLEHLHHNKHVMNLGIVGCGNLANKFLESLNLLGWTIDNCYMYDKNQSRIMSNESKPENIKNLYSAESLKDLLNVSDVVLFTTTAQKPYIDDINLFKSTAVVLNISLRDIHPNILLSSYNIVDDIEHVLTANTSPHLAYIDSGKKDFIAGNIMQLVLGEIKSPSDSLKIFSPMGMGILDIALANLLLTKSIEDNLFTYKDFF